MVKKYQRRVAPSDRKKSVKAARPRTQRPSPTRPQSRDIFPVVGIGASAGGLEAVTELLEAVPATTGMAFAVISHLDPTHESALTTLLSRVTPMSVMEAKNNLRIHPNRVYVIPPNKIMRLEKNRLKLSPRVDGKVDRIPVDHFFNSIAKEKGPLAVGIILSGNGSDGTLGVQAIKSAGGMNFAQETRTAKYKGMPDNAIATGCVDIVMSPDKIGSELRKLASALTKELELAATRLEGTKNEKFAEIIAQLKHHSGVDFTYYKPATLGRRIDRRMALLRMRSLKEYSDHLRSHSDELNELFGDILIQVTSFFRDPEVFQALKKKLLLRLMRNKPPGESFRIWVPGCSSGEEVYSLAIVLAELMSDKKIQHPVQIFATDINEKALAKSRSGIYSENIKSEISADRLRRFFVRTSEGYRVNKTIREMCIFARQNLAADPPFSNLDLISCRNVLIYLGPALQRKVMPMFHYALKPGGLLLLGTSETIGSFADLFYLVDRKAKAYAKKAGGLRPAVAFSPRLPELHHTTSKGDLAPAQHQVTSGIGDVQKQADRIMMLNYSPAGVIINKQSEVLQFRGRTGLYLEHPHGDANFNLFKMAREGLLVDLRAAVSKAMKQGVRVRQNHVRVRQNGDYLECSIEVIPYSVPPISDKFFLVLFHPADKPSEEKTEMVTHRPSKGHGDKEKADLRKELAATRESLEAIIEEQESTNEELQSANEEIMSSNEELQSTNEELETAKEELQSTNEELTTLNDELESRNNEMEVVNNDLRNLLASVNIPVIIVNSDLRIRRFTSMAENVLKLIPGDVGRPLTDINIPLDLPTLASNVESVIEDLVPKDMELQDKEGHWWSVRIRAYKTSDNKIDGAVMALVNIDAMKRSMDEMTNRSDFSEAIVNTVREPLLVLDKKLVVKSANQSFLKTFKTSSEDTIGRRIYQLGDGQWNIPRLRTLLEDILAHNESFNDFEVEHDFPRIGKKKMLLNARKLSLDGKGDELILLAFQDI